MSLINLKKSNVNELYCYEIALLNVVINLQNQINDIRKKRKQIEEKENEDEPNRINRKRK